MSPSDSPPARGHLWLNLVALVLPFGSAWLLSGMLLLVPLLPVALALLGLLNSVRAIAGEQRAPDDAEAAAERAQHFAIFSLSLSGIGLVVTLFVFFQLASSYP